MMAAASRGEFEVLLVGYVSRWQRNLRRTLELLEDTLHPAGVAVLLPPLALLPAATIHLGEISSLSPMRSTSAEASLATR